MENPKPSLSFEVGSLLEVQGDVGNVWRHVGHAVVQIDGCIRIHLGALPLSGTLIVKKQP